MLKPGDLVGPYEIRGFIGQGGMGRVYRAFDPRLERTIALKVIVVPHGEPGRTESGRLTGELSGRLLREARAVASLSHPNVVAIYDVGEHERHLYLAMEYVVGTTLRALVGAGEPPLARRIRWMIDVARALEAAHRSGIVHRDVKPENVMVREDGTVKVLDFGIARRTVQEAEDQHAVDTVTGGGTIAGTPVYMAPEQIRGRDVDARCDQFAWAVMTYELLAGRRPWPDSGDVLSLVATILTDPVPPLRAECPEVPEAVEETLLRALAKDPNARFASMADLADALEPFAAHSTASAKDRVRISPALPPRDDPTAFAATTRVPSTEPKAEDPRGGQDGDRRTSRRRTMQLAVPLVLLAALAATTAFVVRRPPVVGGVDAPRPLSAIPEAEAAYAEAMSLWHDGSRARAEAALRRAIELDPTFAAAHLQLAIQTTSEDPIAGQSAFQSAFEHRQMLVARDAVLLDASEPYVRPRPDLGEWETRLTAAVFQYPRDPQLQLYLGRAREKQGDDEGAKAAYGAAVRLDPSFVPGLAAIASVERNLGATTEALATTERCLKESPVATTCLDLRVRLLSDAGECGRARAQAAEWAVVEPHSPAPFGALARALHADGAPRPALEEVLERRWTLLPEPTRARGELWDRLHLAILDGDLARAEELAREYEAGLPRDADAYDRAQPALARVYFLLEMERSDEAARVAREYLDRMAAWAPYPFAQDPSMAFYEPLARTGAIDKARLDEQRARWLEAERQRLHGDRARPNGDWLAWSTAWGGLVETREEAAEALRNLPSAPLPQGGRRPLVLDFNLGKAYALIGRADSAISHLTRVTSTCSSFDDAMLILRARYYLGIAHEAKGELGAARASYERVVAGWPRASASRTVAWASRRLTALGRR
jgi:eukaryotic-like serine/threonine-protein kinase